MPILPKGIDISPMVALYYLAYKIKATTGTWSPRSLPESRRVVRAGSGGNFRITLEPEAEDRVRAVSKLSRKDSVKGRGFNMNP
jgi:hypothetical protein